MSIGSVVSQSHSNQIGAESELIRPLLIALLLIALVVAALWALFRRRPRRSK